tara:strand:+ start:216 stop:410 length:195 start_codon:yes stop_codon:yes gene_type:complete
MKQNGLQYKTAKYLTVLLEKTLAEKRKELKFMSRDSDVPKEVYQKTLDSCKEIEYTMEEVRKFL